MASGFPLYAVKPCLEKKADKPRDFWWNVSAGVGQIPNGIASVVRSAVGLKAGGRFVTTVLTVKDEGERQQGLFQSPPPMLL